MSCAVVLLVGVQWIGFTHPWLISTLNIDLLWLLLPLLCCGSLALSLRPFCLLLLVLTIGLFAQSRSLGEDPACFDQCALVGTIIGVKPMADHDQISLSVAPARLGSQVTRLEPLRVRAGLEAKTRKVGESMTAVVRLTRRTSNVNFYQGTWFGHQFSHKWRGAKLIRIDAISEQCRPPRVCALAKWRDAIGAMSLPPKLQGTLLALILGQSESIDANLWRALQQTGTIHLMVVSGLHVGFLMLAFFKVLRWIQLPATFCLVLAATVGMGYVAVIGVAIPSLRAWVMTSFLLLSQVSRSWQTNSVSFLSGLLVTLLLFPYSVADPGFWFSFSAVAYLVSREQFLGGWVAWIRSAIEIQLSLILISWPILMLQGLPVSPLAGLFNLLAVPTVIFFLFPICWVLALVAPFDSSAVGFPLAQLGAIGAHVTDVFWALLTDMGAQTPLRYALPINEFLGLVALFACLISAGARSWLSRSWSVYLLVALVMIKAPLASRDALEVWVLDVGQGTAVLMRHKGMTLLFDTGPKNQWFDAGERVLVPFLDRLGVERLHYLVVSHEDNDHAGGRNQMTSIFATETTQFVDTARCRLSGRQHERLRLSTIQAVNEQSTNDRSCNLVVQYAGATILLMGDPSHDAEKKLIAQTPGDVDLLLVSHHGAESSSGAAWLNHVKPKIAVISAGANNPFGHPSASVLKRLSDRGARVLTTSTGGAFYVWFNPGQQAHLSIKSARDHLSP